MNDFSNILQLAENIILTSTDAAHLKDAKSGKYILSNSLNLSIFKLKENDFINRTIWDINDKMSTFWLDNAYQMDKYEEQVRITGKPLIKNERIWLKSNGLVWRHTMNKLPIHNTKGSVSAILSIGKDITHELSLDELYTQYKHFYKNKREAIIKFLEHVGITQDLFYDMPNNNELRTLIAKAKFHTNKVVANHLEFALKTTDHYINQLGRKAKNLQAVLDILRLW